MPGGHEWDLEAVVIAPRRGSGKAPVSPVVVMTFVRQDYRYPGCLTGAGGNMRGFADCPFRDRVWDGRHVTIVGPAPGAPYAVLVLEKLIALGAQAILVLGWCGSLQPDLALGDLMLPLAARSEEGTSAHYPMHGAEPRPDVNQSDILRHQLIQAGLVLRAGTVWTTDALYRETCQKVKTYSGQGILAVEMEMSALFTAGRYRQAAAAGLLVVSDELWRLQWRKGFRDRRFRQARHQAARTILATAAARDNQNDRSSQVRCPYPGD